MYVATFYWTHADRLDSGNPIFYGDARTAVDQTRRGMRLNLVRATTIERAKGGRLMFDGDSAGGYHVSAVIRKIA